MPHFLDFSHTMEQFNPSLVYARCRLHLFGTLHDFDPTLDFVPSLSLDPVTSILLFVGPLDHQNPLIGMVFLHLFIYPLHCFYFCSF